MANLDLVFLTVAAASPAPSTATIDKMTAILTHNGIECVICITKSDLSPASAHALADIYTRADFPVFTLSSVSGEGIDRFRAYIEKRLVSGCIAAFAGASMPIAYASDAQTVSSEIGLYIYITSAIYKSVKICIQVLFFDFIRYHFTAGCPCDLSCDTKNFGRKPMYFAVLY